MLGQVTTSAPLPCDLCRVRDVQPPLASVEQIRMTVRDLHATVALCGGHRAEVEDLTRSVLLARRLRSTEGQAFPRMRSSEDREDVRAWARAEGLPVASSGTLSGAALR
jgi:hypothetical protein